MTRSSPCGNAEIVIRLFSLITFLWLTNALLAQSSTTSEPGVYNLNQLIKEADKVALVRIISGDAEHYQSAVYKSEVVQPFKGTSLGEKIYFGPFVGHRLGWEYFVFLRDTHHTLKPLREPEQSFGPVHYFLIFNEGYTGLETSYQCKFKGAKIEDQCDHAVRICTDYIKVPNALELSPPLEQETPFGCRWTRRKQFISVLQKLTRKAP